MEEVKNGYFKHHINNIFKIHQIVTLNYFEFASDFHYKGEKHNFWELVYVDKGKLTVETDGEVFTLNQGECVFHKPNEFHCHSANGINAPNYFVICFVCNSSYMNVFRNKRFILTERLKRFISNIITEAQQVFDLPENDPEKKILKVVPEELLGGQQMIRTYLEQFLILLLRKEYGEANKFLEETKEENNLASQLRRTLDMYIYQDFSVEHFCKQMKYSKAYLSKIFFNEYGQTIHEYVTSVKIKEAKVLIREHIYNFTQISDMLCFSNPLYFSRVFKKHTGMSPSEYKKSVKSN